MKIERENQRRLEAEVQAAINLKEMKSAQYEADLAAHKRQERMRQLKAKQYRHLQEVAWTDIMEWEERDMEAAKEEKAEAMKLFSEQRAVKKAEEVNAQDQKQCIAFTHAMVLRKLASSLFTPQRRSSSR